MVSLAFAESSSPQPSLASSPFISMMPLLVIFAIFYFLLVRPQQKKAKSHSEMLKNLKKGDRVITSSGFYATVIGIAESNLELKLADNVRVKILKNSISEVLGDQEPVVTPSLKTEEIKK